jgi:hypothetical protein
MQDNNPLLPYKVSSFANDIKTISCSLRLKSRVKVMQLLASRCITISADASISNLATALHLGSRSGPSRRPAVPGAAIKVLNETLYVTYSTQFVSTQFVSTFEAVGRCETSIARSHMMHR